MSRTQSLISSGLKSNTFRELIKPFWHRANLALLLGELGASVGNGEESMPAAAGDGVNIDAPVAGAGEVLSGALFSLIAASKIAFLFLSLLEGGIVCQRC